MWRFRQRRDELARRIARAVRYYATSEASPFDTVWWTCAQLRDLEIDPISPEILRAVVVAIDFDGRIPILEGEWYELAWRAQQFYRDLYL